MLFVRLGNMCGDSALGLNPVVGSEMPGVGSSSRNLLGPAFSGSSFSNGGAGCRVESSRALDPQSPKNITTGR